MRSSFIFLWVQIFKMMKKKRSIKEIGDDCDGLSGDENEPKEKVNKSTPHEVRWRIVVG